jgi:hypothetical protein
MEVDQSSVDQSSVNQLQWYQKKSGVIEIKASLPVEEFVSLQTVSCYPN